MLVINLLIWWYTAGFATRAKTTGRRLSSAANTFSIGQLLRTLFAPFKQIDAGATGKGPTEMFQAFLGRMISRLVGFMMRTFMILFGLLVMLFWLVIGLIALALHLALPLALPASIVLAIIGWLPPPLPEVELVLW